MASFIEMCNCKGARPVGVIGKKLNSRPNLIGSLLKDRHVARFIVAPTGFGKSSLVYDYANIIFSFRHVFWIRCTSPCFLRDLDAKSLFSDIVSHDRDVRLVVCEDVPVLDAGRMQLFGEFVDSVLEMNCELIATCTPSCCGFVTLQPDCIRLDGADLMLADDEMDMEVLRGNLAEDWRETLSFADRIACLRWADGGCRQLLCGFGKEDLLSEIRVAAFVILICQKGSVGILSDFIGHVDDVADFLMKSYPFLGIDMRKKRFESFSVGIDDISKAFSIHMEDIFNAPMIADKDAFCNKLADALVLLGEFEKAACFLMEFSSKQNGAAWIALHAWRFLERGYALCCLRLIDHCKRGAKDVQDELMLLRCWTLHFLGDDETCAKSARRMVLSPIVSDRIRLDACILLVEAEGSPEAAASLAEWLADEDRRYTDESYVETGVYRAFDRFELASLLFEEEQGSFDRAKDIIACARRDAASSASSLSGVLSVEPIDDEADAMPVGERRGGADTTASMRRNDLFFLGCKILRRHLSGNTTAGANDAAGGASLDEVHDSPDYRLGSRCVLDYLRDELDRAQSVPFNIFLHRAAVLMEKAADRNGGHTTHALLPDTIARVNKDEVGMVEQREEYRRYQLQAVERRLDYQKQHPDIFRKNEINPKTSIVVASIVPNLHVNLFGGLRASIGGDPVDPKLLSRKKVRAILALLVIGKGRELSREHIIANLWPEEGLESFKRNFYGLWSQLKKALTVDDVCPYLIRSQDGYRLDMKYVTSDMYVFDDLCRKLLFGTDDSVMWERLYTQVNEDFFDDFMPGESEIKSIAALRDKFRNNLIDGLIATSSRLHELGEPQGALWFAREAIRRDDKREDSYIALMEAQIASNQRGAALETYFACRTFLSEELGIDPSLKVIELYRSIIESEEDLI